MPISLRTNALFTLELGSHRLDRILSAKTRNEALEMGPWDGLKNWWYAGEKSTCVVELYEAFNSPEKFFISSSYSQSQWQQDSLCVFLDELLCGADKHGKSFSDRFADFHDLGAVKKYLTLLDMFMHKASLDAQDKYRDLVVSSLLKLSLPLILGNMQIADEGAARSLILDFLSTNTPELTRKYIKGLLTNADILSALDRGDFELESRISMLLDRSSSDEIRTKNPAISDSVKDFFNNGEGKIRLYNAVLSGNKNAICVYVYLLQIISPQDRVIVINGLLMKQDGLGQSLLRSAFRKGGYQAVTAVLNIAPEQLHYAIVSDLFEDQHEDFCFGRALRTGNLTDFNSCKELLQRLAPGDAQRVWQRMVLDYQDGILDAFTGGAAKDIQRYQALILEIIEAYSKYSSPSELMFALENIPATMLEQAVEIVLNRSFEGLAEIFDPLEVDPAESLLRLIERLSDEQNDLKKRLAVQILRELKWRPGVLELCTPSFERIWLNNPIYMDVPQVAAFFIDPVIAQANTGMLKTGDCRLPRLLDYVHQTVEAEKSPTTPTASKFMIKNNGFFVQLICRCTNHSDPALKKKAEDLYDSYLNLPELNAHKDMLEAVFGVDDGIRSFSVDDAGEKIAVTQQDKVYLFIRFSVEKTFLDGILLSADEINKILSGDPAFDWPTNGFLIEKMVSVNNLVLSAASQAEVDVATALADFPVFAKSVQGRLSSQAWKGLLDLLDLNYRQETGVSGPVDYNYRHDFNQALSFNASSTKLVGQEHQERLGMLFGRHLQFLAEPGTQRSEPTLTQTHIGRIYELYGLAVDTPVDKLDAARKLFCLAAIFIRLSSDDYFGIEASSPLAVRYYAAALLRHVHMLDPTVCDTQYEDMMNRLLGRRSKPTESQPEGHWPETCTHVLYHNFMVRIALSQPNFKKIFKDFKPKGWSEVAL